MVQKNSPVTSFRFQGTKCKNFCQEKARKYKTMQKKCNLQGKKSFQKNMQNNNSAFAYLAPPCFWTSNVCFPLPYFCFVVSGPQTRAHVIKARTPSTVMGPSGGPTSKTNPWSRPPHPRSRYDPRTGTSRSRLDQLRQDEDGVGIRVGRPGPARALRDLRDLRSLSDLSDLRVLRDL